MQQHFARKLPAVEVTGANYPPPMHMRLLATAAGATSMLGMIAIPLGDKIFGLLGMAAPPFYTATVAPNKMACFGALWVGNNLIQSMAQTGAFEVAVNGKTVFSKLAEGRMPQLDELDAKVVAALH